MMRLRPLGILAVLGLALLTACGRERQSTCVVTPADLVECNTPGVPDR